jgi:hypothetical protein
MRQRLALLSTVATGVMLFLAAVLFALARRS